MGLALALCAAIARAEDRPNIVFILLDNVGQEWFGCYGSEEGCTPNIDSLARTGVRIENCYAPPICGPSRTALLTGRYPHSTGFRLHHDAALYSGGGLDPQREIIFPRLLRDAGYATGITGKWQINNLYDEPDALTRHGFQEHLVWPGSIDFSQLESGSRAKFEDIVRREAFEEAVAFNQHIESRYWDPVFLRNGKREVLKGRFGPDVSREFAIDFLRRHREGPFCLYLPMVLTHGQTFSTPAVPTPLNLSKDRQPQEMFADMLRYADQIVGEIVAEIERLGLRENTIVFVASDNGTEHRFQARRNGRTVQGDLYSLSEAGGNVVLMANSPRLVPGGRTLALADFTDVYPTICELASVPLSPQHRVDGQSFAAFLRGKPSEMGPRTWILNEYHETRVVRDTQHKLYSDGRFFDASNDPTEKEDLAHSNDARVIAACERLQKVLVSLPADVPPPFPLRSLFAFRIRTEAREKAGVEAKARP
jgi:arylsulfatase A-like enzyme